KLGGVLMDLNLSGKIVLVSGASKGIGKAIATEFAKENAVVYLVSRTEANLKKAVTEITEATNNQHVNYLVADMKKSSEIKQVVSNLKQKHEKIDVLINNAGGPPPGSFLDVDEEDWYHAFEQNLLSVVRMTKEVIPLMLNTNGPGKIKTDQTIQLGKSVAEKSGKSMDEVMEEMAKDIPLGRLGMPEEFAKTAVFLASEANTYVTGQALLVDGASVSAL